MESQQPDWGLVAGFSRVDLSRYQLSIARTTGQYRDAFRLLQRAYRTKGIENDNQAEMRVTPQHILPESTVVIAREGRKTVGTLTVTLDSPAGLPLDKDYRGKLDGLRTNDANLVEFGSYAVDPGHRGSGVATLLALTSFWWSFRYLRPSHVVIGVNPNAEAYYENIWGFSSMGVAKAHAELDAPVLGLCLESRTLIQHLRRFDHKMQTGLPPWMHVQPGPPPALESWPGPGEDHTRWKLPRSVLQDLFMGHFGSLDGLEPEVRAHLRQVRSEMTLGLRRPRRVA